MSRELNQDRARIFRITHRDNLPWILRNGLHCATAGVRDPDFVEIGNPDLIARRRVRTLPAPFGGVLSDYVPFYFTPFSPMLYNIHTGWGGIRRRDNAEIVILASSIERLTETGTPFVFSDRHAYLQAARFYDDPDRLDVIDWDLLQRRDFKRDIEDPGKFERYEAEALVRTHVPIETLLGLACYDAGTRATLQRYMESADVEMKVIVKPNWYFS
jgi:hypothetical protein